MLFPITHHVIPQGNGHLRVSSVTDVETVNGEETDIRLPHLWWQKQMLVNRIFFYICKKNVLKIFSATHSNTGDKIIVQKWLKDNSKIFLPIVAISRNEVLGLSLRQLHEKKNILKCLNVRKSRNRKKKKEKPTWYWRLICLISSNSGEFSAALMTHGQFILKTTNTFSLIPEKLRL